MLLISALVPNLEITAVEIAFFFFLFHFVRISRSVKEQIEKPELLETCR